MGHRFGKARAHVLVEAAQDIVGAEDLRHLRAQTRENAGEFDRDIAAADDHQPLWKLLEVENLVRRNRQFDAGDRRVQGRRAASRDEDHARRHALAGRQPHGVRALEGRPGGDHLDAGLFQVCGIDAREPRDFAFLGRDQGRPVETRARDAPAEARRILEILGEPARVDVKLLRHAPTDDAGAADTEFLGYGDLRAVAGRNARGADAAGTRADDEEIVVEVAHGSVLPDVTSGDPSWSSLRVRGSSCPATSAAASAASTHRAR